MGAVRNSQAGLTLIELMVVVVVVGTLAARASWSASVQAKNARRTEVLLGLDTLAEAQHAYMMEYGEYSGTFTDLIFDVENGRQISDNVYEGDRYSYTLSQPWGRKSYYVVATGQIDQDPFPDVVILEAGRTD